MLRWDQSLLVVGHVRVAAYGSERSCYEAYFIESQNDTWGRTRAFVGGELDNIVGLSDSSWEFKSLLTQEDL